MATVFNYFPTKEALFFFPLEAFEAHLLEAVATRAAGEPAVVAFRASCSPPVGCWPRSRPVMEGAGALADGQPCDRGQPGPAGPRAPGPRPHRRCPGRPVGRRGWRPGRRPPTPGGGQRPGRRPTGPGRLHPPAGPDRPGAGPARRRRPPARRGRLRPARAGPGRRRSRPTSPPEPSAHGRSPTERNRTYVPCGRATGRALAAGRRDPQGRPAGPHRLRRHPSSASTS